ncbi:MAG: hypothetical protein ACRC2M_00290, partial [Planktothrix sp.]
MIALFPIPLIPKIAIIGKKTDQEDIYRFTLNRNSDVELIVGAVNQETKLDLIKDYNNNGQV